MNVNIEYGYMQSREMGFVCRTVLSCGSVKITFEVYELGQQAHQIDLAHVYQIISVPEICKDAIIMQSHYLKVFLLVYFFTQLLLIFDSSINKHGYYFKCAFYYLIWQANLKGQKLPFTNQVTLIIYESKILNIVIACKL